MSGRAVELSEHRGEYKQLGPEQQQPERTPEPRCCSQTWFKQKWQLLAMIIRRSFCCRDFKKDALGYAIKAVLLVALFCTGYFPLKNQVDQLGSTLDKMQSQIAVFEPTIQLLQIKLDAVEQRVPAIAAQIDSATLVLAHLNATLNSLNVATLTHDIRGLKSDVISAMSSLKTAQSLFANFSTSVNAMTMQVAVVQRNAVTSIHTLNGTVWSNIMSWSAAFHANFGERS